MPRMLDLFPSNCTLNGGRPTIVSYGHMVHCASSWPHRSCSVESDGRRCIGGGRPRWPGHHGSSVDGGGGVELPVTGVRILRVHGQEKKRGTRAWIH